MDVAHPYDWSLMARSRRVALNLSQADLAARIGIGRQWVIDFEGGKTAVEFGRVVRLLRALDIGVALDLARPSPDWIPPLDATPIRPRRPAKRLPPESWRVG